MWFGDNDGFEQTETPIEKKLSSFADLKVGWDYGSGGPIDEIVLFVARQWLNFIGQQGFSFRDVFPGSQGAVTIAAGIGDHFVEIIIEPDLSVSVAYDFKNKQRFYRLRQSSEEAMKSVREALGEIWSASISSIQKNTVSTPDDLFVKHSGTIEDHYQSSKWFAPPKIAAQFVLICEPVTDIWVESVAIPQFSGDSTQIFYLRNVA